MTFLARVVYPAGGAGSYAVPFPYIDKSHIEVFEAGSPYTGTVSWTSSTVISLTPDPSSSHSVEIRRVTPQGNPLVVFAPGALSSSDLNLAETQLLYLEQEQTDAGGVATGVISVNGRVGNVGLTAADVYPGFGTAVGAALAAGLNITLSTFGGITTINSSGGGGGGAVSSVAGRTGAVNLTAADVSSGFGAAVGGALAAGTGVSLVTSGGITTVSASGAVSSVAGRSGAVVLAAADITNFGAGVASALAAGSNISLSSSGGVTTINASASSGGGATSSTFVGVAESNTISGSTITVPLPTGSNTGDLCILGGAAFTGSPIVPSGWTTLYSGTDGSAKASIVAWKILSAADITAASVAIAGFPTAGGAILATYRGPNAVSLAGDAEGAPTITIAGFAKLATDIGVVTLWLDPNGSRTPTAPASPFTARFTTANDDVGLADAIGASVYVNGTSIVWTTSGTLHAHAFALELRNDGAGGGTAGVASVNSRTGIVTLSAADVSSGFGAQVAANLAAGANVTLSTSGGVTTIAATPGAGGVSSVNSRTGAVSLTAADVSAGFGAAVGGALTAGTNVTLSTSGGVTTINAAAGGSAVTATYPAFENNIKVANSATTNTTNLNALIATLFAAGGGTIVFNEPGAISINGQITLKSMVNLKCQGGAKFLWTAGGSGNIFSSAVTDVLIGCDIDILVDEGTSFSGVVFNLHSAQYNRCRVHCLGSNTGSACAQIIADSTAGEFSGGGRNTVFNTFEIFHRGGCGRGLQIQGVPASGSTFGGNEQVVTLNTFYNCQFSLVYGYGFRIEMWADSNTFTGNTYVGIGAASGVGFIVNQAGSATASVYDTTIDQLATDIFGTLGGRYGVVFNQSKGMKVGMLLCGPTLENGSFIGTSCTSYQVTELVNTGSSIFGTGGAAADTLYIHQKGVATGL